MNDLLGIAGMPRELKTFYSKKLLERLVPIEELKLFWQKVREENPLPLCVCGKEVMPGDNICWSCAGAKEPDYENV